MLIQTNFRHPEATTQAFPAGSGEVASLLAHVRPCVASFYRANEAIYSQGEKAGPLYLVEFGTVRICRMTADGRRQINAFHFAGEIFGFEAGTEHQCYAESVDGAGIRVLRPSTTEGFGAGVLAIAIKGFARAQDHLMLLGRMNATEKMAAFLLHLMARQESDRLIDLPMQRNDIADYLGLTVETVSRVLRVLKDSRTIRLTKVEQIEVLSVSQLEVLCE